MSVIEALPIVVNTDGRAECPHCKAVDSFANLDQATRVNQGEVIVENGVIVAANWGEDETNFTTVGYGCTACDKPVLLPDNVGESFS
jgi:hypothetical protein